MKESKGQLLSCDQAHIQVPGSAGNNPAPAQRRKRVTSWRDYPKCKNCGHDRMDHNYDDACWATVLFDGGGGLCKCSGYEPEKTGQESAPHQRKPQSEGQSRGQL